MSWAEVKKINSDMGKSLDKLISDKISALETKIIGQKRFVASDAIIKVLCTDKEISNSEVRIGSFTPSIPATVRVYLTPSKGSSSYQVYLRTYNSSGTMIDFFYFYPTKDEEVYYDIDIPKGVSREFRMRTTSSSFDTNVTVKLGAQIVDAQYFS